MDTSRNAGCNAQVRRVCADLKHLRQGACIGAFAVARIILNPIHYPDALVSNDPGGWRWSADFPLARNQRPRRLAER